MRISVAITALLATCLAASATGRDRSLTLASFANPSICHVYVPPPTGVPETLAGWAKGAQIFQGLGHRTRPITTASLEAQKYFDQGIAWLWAFNHDEATRSFARAAVLDPGCASCFWGVALTIGPNYNLTQMTDPRARVAFHALKQAEALAAKATPVEQALIGALAARYKSAAALNDKNFDASQLAYADAMRAAARQFPDDLDLQTLTAESVMTANAWKLWSIDGNPAPHTLEIITILERVIRADPDHPGANHYYVHALEASPHPERALQAAEHLIGAMPGAGHLEHMPSHIFQRIGRYEDSAEANRRGTAADLAYYRRIAPPDYYGGYTTHNLQFLALGAAMEGRVNEALRAMDGARASLPADLQVDPALVWLQGQRYAYLIRYGRFSQMLAEPEPDAKLKSLRPAWLWGRGTAQAASGQIAAAHETLRELEAFFQTPGLHAAGPQATPAKFSLLTHLLRARIARATNQPDLELTELRTAVATEDTVAYSEPPDFFTPTRQVLGAALLRAGRPAEAEAIYREDLSRTPENGFSLLGLSQALAAQGKPNVDPLARFNKAWAHAETPIMASSF